MLQPVSSLKKFMILLTPGKPCHKPGSFTFPSCLLTFWNSRSFPKGLPANPSELQMCHRQHTARKHFPSPVNICQTKAETREEPCDPVNRWSKVAVQPNLSSHFPCFDVTTILTMFDIIVSLEFCHVWNMTSHLQTTNGRDNQPGPCVHSLVSSLLFVLFF